MDLYQGKTSYELADVLSYIRFDNDDLSIGLTTVDLDGKKIYRFPFIALYL